MLLKASYLVKGGHYADLQKQIWPDNFVIEQHPVVSVRAWDMIEESEKKKSTSFTKIIQGSGEPFTEFFFTEVGFSCEERHIRPWNQTVIGRNFGLWDCNH